MTRITHSTATVACSLNLPALPAHTQPAGSGRPAGAASRGPPRGFTGAPPADTPVGVDIPACRAGGKGDWLPLTFATRVTRWNVPHHIASHGIAS